MCADEPGSRCFAPWPLTRGGHRQTLLGHWFRSRLRWTPPTSDLIIDVGREHGSDVRLLARASWQAEPRRPALVLVHGLLGDDGSTYSRALGLHAWRCGWHVVRLNLRGSGDAMALCPLLYNAGLDGDLLAAVRAVASRASAWAICGFSLGGNLALLMAARRAAALPPGLVASVAVSPPLDLAACADTIARRSNRVYEWRFMSDLRASYRSRRRLRPDLYPRGLEREPRTIREWDDAITARFGGYADADEYYAASSAGPLLAGLGTPALILAAMDDPMIPAHAVSRWALPPSGCVTRELLPTGGHVGFTASTSAPAHFWAAERVLDYLEARLASA